MNDNVTFYDAFAKYYSQYYAGVNAPEAVTRWKKHFESEGYLQSDRFDKSSSVPHLLDLGCGPGWHLRSWQAAGFMVSGLDASPSMLEMAATNAHASSHTDILLYCADVRQTNSLSSLYGNFNWIVSHFNFLNLFSADELAPVFQSIERMLAPDGRFATDVNLYVTPPNCGTIESIILDNIKLFVETRIQDDGYRIERVWQMENEKLVESYWLHRVQRIAEIAKTQGLEISLKRHCSESHESMLETLLVIFSKI